MHQGRWSRGWERNRIQIELSVSAWLVHQDDPVKDARRRVKLGALCRRENRLIVKGLFLSFTGKLGQNKDRDERASHIHAFGFT